MDTEKDFIGGVLKTALGIFLGGLLLWAAAEYRARMAVEQISEAVQESVSQLQASAARQQALREKQRRLQEQQRLMRLQAKRDHAVELSNRQQAIEAAERAKQEAWTRFFQPSAECLKTWSVECGNAQIRARREFDKQYVGSEIARVE